MTRLLRRNRHISAGFGPVLLALFLALPAAAQQAPEVTLVADAIRVEQSGDRLVAEGNVEMLYDDMRLRARRVIYDRSGDRVQIEGPLTLVDREGTTVVADSANLATDLHDGILQSARIVLDNQMQIATSRTQRTQGRFTQMENAVASSCQVCPGGRQVPLWEIRSNRVVHDQETYRYYFDDAQFRVAGVPIAWLPYLSIPDQRVDRANGFLFPTFHSYSSLGGGVSIPYFWALNDSSDLTIAPFVSLSGIEIIEGRYRQAFSNGWMIGTGAITQDDTSDDLRFYAFGEAEFALPQGFTLKSDIKITSDIDYLADYDVGDNDRLISDVTVERIQRDELIFGGIYHYRTLRDYEVQSEIPSLIVDGTWRNRFKPGGWIGGQGEWSLEAYGYRRDSHDEIDVNGDGVTDGRDARRMTLGADWRRDWMTSYGAIVTAEGDLRGNVWWINDDPSETSPETAVIPTLATSIRWPLVRAASQPGGAVQILEPMAQLVWSPSGIDMPENEDSTLVEFDEGNLFSLDRFPGADDYEQGLRLNIGLTWTRIDAAGRSLGLTFGRIIRKDSDDQFTEASGLQESDWLAVARFDWNTGVSILNRAIFDDGLSFSKNELRIDWDRGAMDLGSSYVWVEADEEEYRPGNISEWVVDATYDINPRWQASADWRYDFTEERAVRGGVGFIYRNECVEVDVSVSRRYRNSDTFERATRFNLSVELLGIGSGNAGRAARRQCIG